jgi:hypothetical protein
MNTKNMRHKLLSNPLHNAGYWIGKATLHRVQSEYACGFDRIMARISMRTAALSAAHNLRKAKAEGLL